jgi:hypothetical protein
MANEAVRTRQYREYLDADKTISRQIYNLYQRQEAAYKEGTPAIRNQNQLAPISGVIEAVNALQSELQNLMSSATNNYFKFSTNNFVPVIKAYNSLVFALRSIQNIYKRNVQIKYEVDKLLKPVIEMIQSVASQLAYDPAVSNRLFQMRTNLLSKVFERIDYNVGKRILMKLEDEETPSSIATFEPGSDETLDTFEQPVMQYNPESNDPFLGQTPIKPEAPATFEGLDVAGINLTEEDKRDLVAWQNAKKDVFKKTPDDWSEEVSPIMSKRKVKDVIDARIAKIRSEYSELSANAKKLIEKNNMQQFEAIEMHLTDTLNKFIEQRKERLKKSLGKRAPPPPASPIEFVAAEDENDEQPARVSPVKLVRLLQQVAVDESPKTIIRRITQPVDEMTVAEMGALLKSAKAWDLLNRKDTFLPGKKYEEKAATAIEKYKKDPQATVDYFKNTLNIDIPLPQQKPKSSSRGKTPQLQSPFAASPQQAPNSSSSKRNTLSSPFASSAIRNVAKGQSQSKRKQPGFLSSLLNFAAQDPDDD